MQVIGLLLVILACAGASVFFALAESALLALGPGAARRLAEQRPGAGECLGRLLDRPADVLATIVLGNTLANAGLVATGLWLTFHHGWSVAGTVAGLLLGILIGCEVVPKTLAVRRPKEWSLRLARPLWLLQRVSRPFLTVALGVNAAVLQVLHRRFPPPSNSLSDAEYRELIELAYQQGTLAQSEKEIILQIVRLDRRTVREVMRPRSRMAFLSDDLPLEDLVAAARRLRHRWMPLYDETADTIVGVLNTRTLLLNPDDDLSEAIELPSFVPESMNLLQLLKSLQRQQRGMAVVLDEFGGTAGIVTIEDILEAMIGEIRGESEETGFVMEKLGEGCWRVNGTMRLEDFQREYPALKPGPEAETLGGLMIAQLEQVPALGQSVVVQGLRLTALTGDERRVRELRVEVVKHRSDSPVDSPPGNRTHGT